jgi:hypothetical protein
MVHSGKDAVVRHVAHSRRLEPATLHWIKTLEQQGIAPSQQLFEHFPHVLNKIAAAWGNVPAMEALMTEDLMVDNRGNRQGFPFKILVEIQALHHAHQAHFANGASAPSAWDSVHPRRNG